MTKIPESDSPRRELIASEIRYRRLFEAAQEGLLSLTQLRAVYWMLIRI